MEIILRINNKMVFLKFNRRVNTHYSYYTNNKHLVLLKKKTQTQTKIQFKRVKK